MNPKYWREQVVDGKSSCPWCENINNHRATATCCDHVAKVQSNGTVLYYWGIRPLTERDLQPKSMCIHGISTERTCEDCVRAFIRQHIPEVTR